MAERLSLPLRVRVLAWLQIPLILVAAAVYAYILWSLPPLLRHQAALKTEIKQLQTTKNDLETRVGQLNATISVIPPEQLKGALEVAPQQITSKLPPRIYVQIATEEQRKIAEMASRKLRSAGFIVPGIEDVGKKAPDRTEIRYFVPDEGNGPDLKAIEQTLSAAGIPAIPKYTTLPTSSKIRPRHFELWFGESTSVAA
jgi:hypothetical protein